MPSVSKAPTAAHPGRWLIAIFGVALLLRSWAWWQTAVLFDDGPRFLYMADAFSRGEILLALRQPQHPLYPAVTALLGMLFPGLEQAAAALSIAAGSVAAVCLYPLVRPIYGSALGLAAAAIAAVHPTAIEQSCDVQSDALYLCLFLLATWGAARALATGGIAAAAGAGAAAGLAYLVRPDALGLVAAMGLAWLLRSLQRREPATDWRAPLALASVFAVALGIYALGLHAATGVWSLTSKPAFERWLSLDDEVGKPRVERFGHLGLPGDDPAAALDARLETTPLPRPLDGASDEPPLPPWRLGLWELYSAFAVALRFEWIPALGVGLWLARRRSLDCDEAGAQRVVVVALWCCFSAILMLLAFQNGYVSRRHAWPLLMLLLGPLAAGLGALAQAAGRWMARWRASLAERAEPSEARGLAWGVLVLFLCSLPLVLPARRTDRLPERLAAEWVRSEGGLGHVASRRGRVAYYADRVFVPVPEGDPGEQGSWLRYLPLYSGKATP